jgi:hypothetical protein
MNGMLSAKRREGRFLLWGLLLWLVATVIFRLFGDRLMDAGNPVGAAVCFIAAVPLIYGCTAPLYAWLNVPHSDRLRCSACIALPGMVLDIFSLLFHRAVFPLIPDESVPVLAAWLLWAYSLILATGFVGKGKRPL